MCDLQSDTVFDYSSEEVKELADELKLTFGYKMKLVREFHKFKHIYMNPDDMPQPDEEEDCKQSGVIYIYKSMYHMCLLYCFGTVPIV